MESTKQINILLVDDKEENLFSLQTLLEDKIENVNYVKCSSGHEALKCTLEMDLAVILLDVQMPNMDGYEVARILKKSNRTKNIPIIFLTAISRDEEYIEQGYDMGAVDYLFKPINPVILIAKVKSFIEIHRLQNSLNDSNAKLEQYANLLTEGISDSIVTIRICANDLKANLKSPDEEKKLDIIMASADKVKETIRKTLSESKMKDS